MIYRDPKDGLWTFTGWHAAIIVWAIMAVSAGFGYLVGALP